MKSHFFILCDVNGCMASGELKLITVGSERVKDSPGQTCGLFDWATLSQSQNLVLFYYFKYFIFCVILIVSHALSCYPSSIPLPVDENNPNYEKGEFHLIQQLVKSLPNGTQVKQEVQYYTQCMGL